MENDLNIKSKIEAFLFWKGERVSKKEIMETFKIDRQKLDESVNALLEDFSSRGVRLFETEDDLEIRVIKEVEDLANEHNKNTLTKELSKASMETLSIILYKNGATRGEIDYIRGVNSTFILRNLSIRGLVEKYTDPNDSRKILYKPTIDLLGYLGIERTNMLPSFPEYNSILNKRGEDLRVSFEKEEGIKNEETTEENAS